MHFSAETEKIGGFVSLSKSAVLCCFQNRWFRPTLKPAVLFRIRKLQTMLPNVKAPVRVDMMWVVWNCRSWMQCAAFWTDETACRPSSEGTWSQRLYRRKSFSWLRVNRIGRERTRRDHWSVFNGVYSLDLSGHSFFGEETTVKFAGGFQVASFDIAFVHILTEKKRSFCKTGSCIVFFNPVQIFVYVIR